MNHTSRTGLYIMVIIILISCLHTCDIVESIKKDIFKDTYEPVDEVAQ